MSIDKSLKNSKEIESSEEAFIGKYTGYYQIQSPIFKFRDYDVSKNSQEYLFTFPSMEERKEDVRVEQKLWKIYHDVSRSETHPYNENELWMNELLQEEKEDSLEPLRADIDSSIAISSSRNTENHDEENSSQNNSNYASQPKIRGRRPENLGLSKRKDVVLKNILRRVRTSIWKDFNIRTKYLSKKKQRGIKFFQSCLNFYIKNVLEEVATPELVYKLGSFIYSKDMSILISAKTGSAFGDQISKKIRETNEIHTNS